MEQWVRRPVPLALVIGGGELGSAVVHRLKRSGLRVVVVDVARPTCIRRKVCFAMAALEGTMQVEGITARLADSAEDAVRLARTAEVPVVTLGYLRACRQIRPDVVVDARMAKTGSDISRDLAPLVIGLGPGFEAGGNVDAVVETMRGHDLGRVIYQGGALPFTGVPGEIAGVTSERVIRSPASGIMKSRTRLGSLVRRGQVVAAIAGTRNRQAREVTAPIPGLLRGLIADGTRVRTGQKIGDVDPRGDRVDASTISDKARAVAGGVLEAVMNWWKGK